MLLYMAKETLQMWLRILRWEEYSVLSVWVLCAYKYPFKRKTIGWKSDKMWGLEANVRMMHFEDGGTMSQKMQATLGNWERKQSPLETPEGF